MDKTKFFTIISLRDLFLPIFAVVNEKIEIFVELGKRLGVGIPDVVLSCAISQNGWFTRCDIELAVEAICREMLQRNKLNDWALASSYKPVEMGENVLIVMAGNLPLVGFFDLLCVVMSGHKAIVKPSHKDKVLMEWVIGELKRIDSNIPIYIYSEIEPIDRVIATGGDQAVGYFSRKYPNIPSLFRGSRHSIAVLAAESEAEELGIDIFSYSGLGCRNVSMLFVPRGFDLARLPVGETAAKHRNNYLRQRALFMMQGVEFWDSGTHCVIESSEFPAEVSVLAVAYYDELGEVERWVEVNDDKIQCIVSSATTIDHPRRVDCGEAQYPSLGDYADGIDTMEFLAGN